MPTTTIPLHPQVERLVKRETFAQRTPGWYQAREKCLTASDISSTMMLDETACGHYVRYFKLRDFEYRPNKGCDEHQSLKKLINKKSKTTQGDSSSGSNSFTKWGVKFEPVAVTLYVQLTGRKVLDFGLVLHPRHSWLGASPDIITTCGRLVEIKCPPLRPVTDVPPLNYAHQMDLQMECCELEVCDFLDVNVIQWMFEDEWEAAARAWEKENPSVKHHAFGILKDNHDDCFATSACTYAPAEVRRTDEFLAWSRGQSGTPFYYEIRDWKLVEYPRSPTWFNDNLPRFRSAWQAILNARRGIIDLS